MTRDSRSISRQTQLGILMAIGGFAFAIGQGIWHTRAKEIAIWPTVPAIIVAEQVVKLKHGRDVWWRYEQRLTYRYVADGKAIESVCPDRRGENMNWQAADFWDTPEEAGKQLPALGTRRVIHFNPDSLEECSLEVSAFSKSGETGLLLALLAIGIAGLAIAWHARQAAI
jgi:hypothetical protein